MAEKNHNQLKQPMIIDEVIINQDEMKESDNYTFNLRIIILKLCRMLKSDIIFVCNFE